MPGVDLQSTGSEGRVITTPPLPTIIHDRLARFVIEATGDIDAGSLSKAVSVIPQTRFHVGPHVVIVGPIKVTITKGK